jgi:hypothetical protein
MAVAYGRNATIAFAQENPALSYKDACAEVWGSPTLVGLYLTKAPDLSPNIESIEEPHLSGRPEMSTSDIAQGIKNYTLAIEVLLQKESLGFIFLSLFGKVTTPAPSGGYYTHTFVPSVASPASLKIQYRSPLATNNTEWRLRGAKTKTFKLIFNQNEFLKFNAEFVGGSWARHTTVSSAPSVAVPSSGSPFFLWSSFYTCQLETVSYPIVSGEITYESVLAEDVSDSYEFGSSERVRLERASTEDAFKVTGSLKAIWHI